MRSWVIRRGDGNEHTGLGSFVVFFWICRFGFGCGEEELVYGGREGNDGCWLLFWLIDGDEGVE
jgi:hypothetical protein